MFGGATWRVNDIVALRGITSGSDAKAMAIVCRPLADDEWMVRERHLGQLVSMPFRGRDGHCSTADRLRERTLYVAQESMIPDVSAVSECVTRAVRLVVRLLMRV